jgi:hypothetical protein
MSTVKSKARVGLYGCEILRIAHCLDSRLTDGGEVLRLAVRFLLTILGTHFSYRLIQPKSNSKAGTVRRIEKKFH